MITGKPQKNLSTAKQYFKNHLAHGEYYREGESISGVWVGKGVSRLGLSLNQPVDQESFCRLCENLHPISGRKLTPRTRKDRRVFYDFTASAPKSVSIIALTVGDKRVLGAHRKALQVAATGLEKAVQTAVQTGGKRTRITTGEMVAAAFEHHESRALDPQLHTHLIVWNLTYDTVEKRWKALESAAMFEQTKFLTEIYRSVLAKELVDLGYRIRNTENGSFEIDGVSPEIIKRFSKRSREIKAAEEKISKELGKPLSNNARSTIAHATRAVKKEGLSQEEIVTYQRSQLSPDEFVSLKDLTQRPPSPAPPDSETSEVVREAFRYAREHLFERMSVVPEHKLLEVALRYARGKASATEILSWMDKEKDLIRSKGEVTTKGTLALEQEIIKYVNQTQNRLHPLSRSFSLDAELIPEQKEASEFILRSTDGVVGLQGGAGTGKTRVLTAIVSAIEKGNERLFLLAPTSGAADVLRREKVGEAMTLQKFLIAEALQEEAKNSVVLVDEAGLISTAQMAHLFRAAQTNRFRVILSGDTRQHHGIEAGDALRILEKFSSLKTAKLSVIHRQKEEAYRKAIQAISEERLHEGFASLDRLGAISETPDETRYESLAQGYLRSQKEGKSALCVSPSWREIELVTEAVRSALKVHGKLGRDVRVYVHKPLHWTEAQKADLRNYGPGHILTFHKKTRDFENGEWAKVARVDEHKIFVSRKNGSQAVVTKKQSHSFEVFKEEEIFVAPGEKLLIRGNDKKAHLLNGQVATVKSVLDSGRIVLEDGRAISPEFRRFGHGYCVTSIASQGKKAAHVYLAVDSIAKAAVDRKQFYVSASRGEEKVQIFTDDRKKLLEEISKTGERTSATEFVKTIVPSFKSKVTPAVSVRM